MNCIIVDDEYPAREELKYFINKFSTIKIEKEFDDAIDALKYLEKSAVDVVFLDINMPKLDGISLSKIISNFHKKPKVIFNTAYKEYAVDAFEVKAFDYILKPYSEERIISTLTRLEECEKKNAKCINNKIALKENDKIVIVNKNNIYYCKACERETLVYTRSKCFSANCSISEFYKKLNENNFFKSHRSYIVNLDKISEIIPWFNNTFIVKFPNLDVEIPVSRNNISKFKHLMGI